MVKEFDIVLRGKNIKVIQLDNGKFVVPDCVKELGGFFGGSQVKPAVEVVLVVMKPLSEKTFVEQALKNGHGGTWLGRCRIPYANEKDTYESGVRQEENIFNPEKGWNDNNMKREFNCNIDGRFPANLLVSDNVLDNGETTNQVFNKVYSGYENKLDNASFNFGEGSIERDRVISDVGGFSRYFSLDAWWDSQIKKLPEEQQKTFPFLITPKASKSEKNKGCEQLEPKYMDESRIPGSLGGTNPRNRGAEKVRLNVHPTVKPLKLMQYLVTLGCNKGETVLDPFVGSGTTCIAAHLQGMNSVGIEMSKEYFEIAKARTQYYSSQQKMDVMK